MRIAVYLQMISDPASYGVDPHSGAAAEQRLLQILDPAAAQSLSAALGLAQTDKEAITEITAYTIGRPLPEDICRQVLALGVKLKHIGGKNWPKATMDGVKGFVLSRYLSDADLILWGQNGSEEESLIEPAYLGLYLKRNFVSAATDIKLAGNKINLTQRLNKGWRQKTETRLPAIISLLSWHKPLQLPSTLDLLAQHVTMDSIDLDYSDILRQIPQPIKSEIIWQDCPRAPYTQKVFKPDSRLSAQQRIKQLIEGAGRGKNTEMVYGTPQETAKRIAEYMAELELIRLK